MLNSPALSMRMTTLNSKVSNYGFICYSLGWQSINANDNSESKSAKYGLNSIALSCNQYIRMTTLNLITPNYIELGGNQCMRMTTLKSKAPIWVKFYRLGWQPVYENEISEFKSPDNGLKSLAFGGNQSIRMTTLNLKAPIIG